MGLHAVRLIFTIIFFMFALARLVAGYWLPAIFWALAAMAVGHPFVRNGRIDLYYDTPPAQVIVLAPALVAAPQAAAGEVPATGPMSVQGAESAPPLYQKLFQGEV